MVARDRAEELIANGDLANLAALLQGYIPTARANNLLRLAVLNDQPEIVFYLLERGAERGHIRGSTRVMRVLDERRR